MADSDVFPVQFTHSGAYEVVYAVREEPHPVVFTCEHASNRLPDQWAWPQDDQWIVDTHWALDIGAAAVTRRLVERSGSVGILAKFSRLLVDANRDVASDTLYRQEAERKPLHLNQGLGDMDKRRRLDTCYFPYHETVDQWIGETPNAPVIAIHSFTPSYSGEVRSMEVGVLFDHSDPLAERVAASLREEGLIVAMNAPYSGKNGMMYSAYRHAADHGRDALELEIRQDLIGDPAACSALADRLFKALSQAGLFS